MDIINRVAKMKAVAKEAVQHQKKIGFVPTMGAIHPGHLSLVRRARAMSDLVLTSIFVNPLQFVENEDYDRYPRDLARDVDLLSQEKVDVVFAPTSEEMYPPGYATYVQVEGLSERLCGASRPGHFRGVTTVVLNLFNIVKPTFAFFGQKDAQQFVIIKRMVKDLNLDIEVVICPTVRESDGLAVSSRNAYLTQEERKAATVLYRALREAWRMITEEGERRSRNLIETMTKIVHSEPLARIDYVSIVDTETLEPLKKIEKEALIAVAAYIGSTRLIDNVFINIADKKE